jgi:hypothetical protein
MCCRGLIFQRRFSISPVYTTLSMTPANLLSLVDVSPLLLSGVGCVHFAKSNWKVTVASFVVIWQNLFNYGLTRLKRFVPTFTDKLCNYLSFLPTFNAPCMRRKIWCDGWKRKYFGLEGGSEQGRSDNLEWSKEQSAWPAPKLAAVCQADPWTLKTTT